MRNIIIIDIDDILHDLNRAIREEAANLGEHYESHHVVDWGFIVSRLGLDRFLTMLNGIYNSEDHYIFDGAAHALEKLSDAGYELHYFTDRPEGYDDVTRDWLAKHGFPQSENLHICRDKREDIDALGADRVLAVIDDRPRTMIWALHEVHVPHIFALRTPYNQNLSDIPGIHLANDWQQLEENMEKILESASKAS